MTTVFAPQLVFIGCIPLDFILFALTLLGIALLHKFTLQVALTGLAVTLVYKIGITGFKTSAGVAGFAAHMGHEWVMLANLLGLLMGFALLSKHFEDSRLPDVLPRILPDDWKGGFVLLLMVFVLSSFLDNIAAALIGGSMVQALFRGKVHIGYLAAIVAASNAGGSGSMVGDTTTTMMWTDGVAPSQVLSADVAAGVAVVVCGVPAALQQQKYSPIYKVGKHHVKVDYGRVAVVAIVLITAVVVNVISKLKFAHLTDHIPFMGLAVWAAILACVPICKPDRSLCRRRVDQQLSGGQIGLALGQARLACGGCVRGWLRGDGGGPRLASDAKNKERTIRSRSNERCCAAAKIVKGACHHGRLHMLRCSNDVCPSRHRWRSTNCSIKYPNFCCNALTMV